VALAKLESAEQNLLRLGDILSELEQQRNSLSKQAKRARAYEELRNRLEYVEGYLWVREYERAETELREVALGIEEKTDQRVSLLTRMGEQEGHLESERLSLLNLEAVFQETQQSLYRLRGEMEKAHAQIEIVGQEGEELKEREEKTRTELLSSISVTEQLERTIAEERRKLENISQEADQLFHEGEGLQQKGEGLLREITLLAQAVEERRREAIRAAALSSSQRNQRAALENQGLKLLQQKTRLQTQQEATSAEIQELGHKDLRLQERSADLVRSGSEWQAHRDQVTADLASSVEEGRSVDLAITQLQRRVDEVSTRLASYEELQRTYSDFGEGARLLLQDRSASSPSISPAKLLAALSELLEPSSGCEKAIEALLSFDLHGLVTDSLEDVRRMIGNLNLLEKGGAIFLPLSFSFDSAISETSGHSPDPASTPPGIVGRAIDLIEYDRRFHGLMRRLFADSLVAEDLETAMALMKEQERPRSIATLQGEVVTSWGAIRLPARSSSGLLIRRREIKDLSCKLEETKEELAREHSRKKTLEDQRQILQEKFEALEREGQKLQIDRVALEKDRGQLSVDFKRAQQQLDYLTTEGKAIEEENDQLKAELLRLAQDEEDQQTHQLKWEGETKDLQAQLDAQKGEHEQILEQREIVAKELRRQEEEQRDKGIQIARLEEQVHSLLQRRGQLEQESVEIQQKRSGIEASLQGKGETLDGLSSEEERVESALKEIGRQREQASSRIAMIQEEVSRVRRQLSEIEGALAGLEIKRAQIDQSLIHLKRDLSTSESADLGELRGQYQEEGMDSSQAEEELAKLRERIRRLEPVNMAALRDYEGLSKRYLFLNGQAEDLRCSVSSLRQTILEINRTSGRLFQEAFRSIDQTFGEYCTTLFGGGSAEIRLRSDEGEGEEEGAPEEGGVEIMVSPPGKHLASLNLLSGGEKALAGLAFLMALFRYRPSPFCLLDEVDAPLDDANVERFLSLTKELSQRHQFILITHNKRTMEAARCLYGVTMEEPGISKVVSVHFDGDGAGKNKRHLMRSARGEGNGD
jgi:chromosome segregation protein